MYSKDDLPGMDVRAFTRNLLMSPGPHPVLGRESYTHFDMAMRGCTATVDDVEVVTAGGLMTAEHVASRRRTTPIYLRVGGGVTPSQSYDGTVVGGGLGWLTTALALRQRGLRVTVLEQASELGEAGAGQTAPNGSRVLIGLGLRPQMEAIHTEPLDQVQRRWQDGRIVGLTSLGQRCKDQFRAPYRH